MFASLPQVPARPVTRAARAARAAGLPGPAGAVRPQGIDAEQLCAQVGQGHRLLAPHAGPSSLLMQGRFSVTRLRDGLSLHCTDVIHLHDMTTQYPVEERSLKVMLRLEGNAQVAMGRQPLLLDAGEGVGAVPQGAVVALNAPDVLQRYSRAGSRQRMVVLTMRPAWFEAVGIPQDLFHAPLTVRPWKPSLRAVALAEQLIHPIDLEGPMQRLHQESRALELILEALSQTLSRAEGRAATLPASAYHRVRRLQQWLDSGAADQLDMRAIAQHMGCNANTLQQQFREVCGMPIFDYLRHSRLQRAAQALQHEGVSVARAAEIAGYSSQANFSTAFRRHFGILPKHCRNRL